MPLAAEKDYWDTVASKSVKMGPDGWEWSDNSWKRPHQLSRLLKFDFYKHKILEIGTGNGIIGGMLRMTSGDCFNYTGTELSEKFRQWAKSVYQLNTVCADVRELPGEGYTRIIAFDSLEHVRPEHREEGYKKIASVAAPGCLLFIHYSHGYSAHNQEFDHPFDVNEIVRIQAAGFTLLSYERYICHHPAGDIPYVFVVMERNK